MSGVRVDVWSDFVCPWCFLASTSLEKLKESHDVEVVWHSYELRPQGSPPMPEAYRARIEASQPQLKQMAREHYGVELKSGPFGINSRTALIGDKYAESQGKGDAYHMATFKAYWQEGRDIEDRAVLLDIAQSVGLDAEKFNSALDEPMYEDAVLFDIEQAQNFGLSGVPALIFANKYLVSGAQPYESLMNIVQQVQAREAAVSG
ncbi:MAG: DsbA family oxidoreductase [Chloroflexota bacterium]